MSVNYNLSICLPGYRINNWERLYNSVYDSCKKYKWEMIIVGPQDINEVDDNLLLQDNFRYIQDKGSPARCGQLATTFANGYWMTWGSDDGYFLENSLDEALDLAYNVDPNDVIAMRYKEGPNFQGVSEPPEWFTGRFHSDQQLDGVLSHWRIAPVGMYRLEYFRWLGGFDCRYLHINLNSHDLCYRAQKNKSRVHLSPSIISTHDWNVNCPTYSPMTNAYHQNDLPLFQKEYSQYNPDRICIDYDNWKYSSPKWKRQL